MDSPDSTQESKSRRFIHNTVSFLGGEIELSGKASGAKKLALRKYVCIGDLEAIFRVARLTGRAMPGECSRIREHVFMDLVPSDMCQ